MTPPEPPTDHAEPDGISPDPSSVISVAPDDLLAGLQHGLAPPVPEIVRDVRRSKAREALFGRLVVRQFGRYVVLDELGRGGMGTVLTAYDPQLDRKVALKLLHDPHAEHQVRRLEREAKALAKLSHPNVVQVYEVGLEDEQRFVAMELVQGQTLRQWQAERRPWRACIEVYLQAGRGLAAAHAKGLVHRDFKPGNCILDEEGRVRVLDFGLVRGSEEPTLDAATREVATDSLDPERSPCEQTVTGTVLGTPAYMPPEQLEGQDADARSDQFSFCVALFEAVYGQRPFAGGSVHELIEAAREHAVRPPPTGARAPLRLRRVLVRGLAARPDERWPSMEALLEQLGRLVVPRARRWAGLSLAVGVLGMGGGLALGQVVEDHERCTDAHRHLANIWDDGRREAVKAAILGTGLNYAPGTWERVERRLNDYADAWASKHTEVCEASAADEQAEHDRRLRLDCMQERSRALRATADVLARADAEVVEKAVELAAGLPGFGRCDDLDALRAVVPPPEDPEVRREVEALREQLADISAAREAGKYTSALEEVEPVVHRAKALAYGPLVAEAKAERGSLRTKNGRYTDAEQDLREAHEAAIEHHHDEAALHTTQRLTFVVGYQQARHSEGMVWGGLALAHAKRSGDESARATSLHNLGVVLHAHGRYKQALPHYERALRIKEKALGPDHPSVAISLHNLGTMLKDQGKHEQARLHLERALQIRQEALGPDHPGIAMHLIALGSVFEDQGEYEQARLHYERALRTSQAALGPDHPSVATSLNNLGLVCYERGEHEQARLYYEQALRIKHKALGPDHPDVATILTNLSSVFRIQGEHEQARRRIERALRSREKALGPDHPDIANSLASLALVLKAQGKYEQARRHLERALRINEEALGPDHPQVAAVLNSLGNVLLARGEHEQARPHLERALRLSEEALGPDHPDVADCLNNLGLVLEAQGEHEQAQRDLDRALRILEKALGPDLPAVAHPLVGLAAIALAQEDFDTARTHAERAVSVRENGKVAPALLARARFVLARALWNDQTQRNRARTLAERARDALTETSDAGTDDLADVEQWLAKHRVR